MSNDVTNELIRSGNYILILDEVMDILEKVNLKKDDIPSMITLGLISVENDMIIWNEEFLDYDGKYNDIKNMALANTLFTVNNVVLMWNFPVEIFKSFKEVYVLTYMFKGQIQRYYYDLHNVDYEYFSVDKINEEYALIQYDPKNERNIVKNLKEKINILEDDKMNSIGEQDFSLSSTWFKADKNKPLIDKLQKNIYNYFSNKVKSKSNDLIWTTFKTSKIKLSGKGYTRGFVSVNARATNEYGDRHNLVYCVNIFLNPLVKQFFINNGVDVAEDIYALSEMLQWIWRSAIRNNEEVNIYIPSKRMRNLLLGYLNFN